MTDEKNHNDRFAEKIKIKSDRKIRARNERQKGLWYGLGMFGLVGWSVAIPTLLFLVAGIWIDTRYQSQYSWTLMMLVLGISLGCLNAWFWVKRESEET